MSDINSDSVYVQIKSPCKKRFHSPLMLRRGVYHVSINVDERHRILEKFEWQYLRNILSYPLHLCMIGFLGSSDRMVLLWAGPNTVGI